MFKHRIVVYMAAMTASALVIDIPMFFEVSWEEIEGFGQVMRINEHRDDPYYVIFYLFLTKDILVRLGIKIFLLVCAAKVSRDSNLGGQGNIFSLIF